jgi:uncharacterized membrane protein YqjE
MTDDGDGSALTLLWVVSLVALAGFAVLCLAAVDPTHGASMAFGPGGLVIGALLATVWQMRKRRRPRRSAQSEVTMLMDRLQVLEQDQQRMAELEERVDFAERMLARAQDDAALPDLRRDGPRL